MQDMEAGTAAKCRRASTTEETALAPGRRSKWNGPEWQCCGSIVYSSFFTGQGVSQRHETRLNQNGAAWLGLALTQNAVALALKLLGPQEANFFPPVAGEVPKNAGGKMTPGR